MGSSSCRYSVQQIFVGIRGRVYHSRIVSSSKVTGVAARLQVWQQGYRCVNKVKKWYSKVTDVKTRLQMW